MLAVLLSYTFATLWLGAGAVMALEAFFPRFTEGR